MIQRPMTRVGGSDECSDRMFYFDFNKAKVEILDSAEDDLLAASMYGDVKKTKPSKRRFNKKQEQKKTTTSGYDFDSILSRGY
jgi:hypothetical protein